MEEDKKNEQETQGPLGENQSKEQKINQEIKKSRGRPKKAKVELPSNPPVEFSGTEVKVNQGLLIPEEAYNEVELQKSHEDTGESDVDYSNIPETDVEFWQEGEVNLEIITKTPSTQTVKKPTKRKADYDIVAYRRTGRKFPTK